MHGLPIPAPIRLRQVDVFEGIEAWECSGTPVDCVKLAKHVLLKERKIDLCLSGINHGSNSSINILYSGTMSAAMEAAAAANFDSDLHTSGGVVAGQGGQGAGGESGSHQ